MEKYGNNTIENILEVEGVNAEGYGITSQAIMFDRDISIIGKSIYAYLCSYLGAGRTSFPKVKTILADLKISENTFYKHFKPLLENGYIKKSKAKGYLNRNVYTICNNVSKLKTPVIDSKSEGSKLAIDGINASGYGFIPKLIMKDKRITAKAKALIAFLYSIAQADCCAYPHRTTICTFLNISKTVYYNCLNQLIEVNYITVKQRHNKGGQFSVNDYILNSNPSIEKTPCPSFCGYGENGLNSEEEPCPSFCGYGENGLNSEDEPCPNSCGYEETHRVLNFEALPCPDFCGNNNITKNNITNLSYISSSKSKVELKLNCDDDIDTIRDKIKKLTWYDYYLQADGEDKNYRRDYLRVVNFLLEMAVETNTQKYGKNYVTKNQIISSLNNCLEEDPSLEEYGFNSAYDFSLRDLIFDIVYHYRIAEGKYDIRNPKKYLKSIIWDDINNYF